MSAVAEAKECYYEMMEAVCGGTKPFLATAHLESEHQRCVEKALYQFSNKRKMGGDEFSQTYMDKLIKVLIITKNLKKKKKKKTETQIIFTLSIPFCL